MLQWFQRLLPRQAAQAQQAALAGAVLIGDFVAIGEEEHRQITVHAGEKEARERLRAGKACWSYSLTF
jgi:hypothetical protein